MSGTTGTPKKEPRQVFIETLAKTGNVSAACKGSRLSRSAAYRLKDEDPEFASAWAEALDTAADALEAEARRRASTGTLKPVFYKGEEVGHIREYSDTLLIFLLKGARPEKYRENVKHEVSGPNGAPIPLALTTIANLDGDELRQRLQDARQHLAAGRVPDEP